MFPAYSLILLPLIVAEWQKNLPANTGRESNSKNAVINTDHTKSGSLCIVINNVGLSVL